jgi:hypothetical protein
VTAGGRLQVLEAVDVAQVGEHDRRHAHDAHGEEAAQPYRRPDSQEAPATPDSKAPSSLDAPMKTFSTAMTRPRISSGVARGTIVARMKTLTASAPERTSRAANAST